MAARQLGFLHSTPKNDGVPIKSGARIKPYIDAGRKPPMIKMGPETYLFSELFDELSPMKPGPNGAYIPIDAQDVFYHCANSGLTWEPWEKTTMVRMARAYSEERIEGESPYCIPPIDRKPANKETQ